MKSIEGGDLAGGVNVGWLGRDADGVETGREVGVEKIELPWVLDAPLANPPCLKVEVVKP